mgnify:CR=1 FL=1
MTTARTIPAGWELHTLPSGDTVAYHDPSHRYFRDVTDDGKGVGRLAGVTTVIAPMDWRPDGLMSWAARLTRDGVAALAAEGLGLDDPDEIRSALSWLRSGETVDAALEDARLRYTDAKDDAARRGSNVHLHALHALAEGRPVPAFDDLTVEEIGYAKGVAGWWLDEQPEVIASEFLVADLELGVAGRPDLLCRLRDGRLAVVDAKTSGYVPAKFAVQLSAYAHLALISGYEAPEVGVILQVAEDGSHRAIPVELDHEDFFAALDVYRRAGRINGALRKAAKA